MVRGGLRRARLSRWLSLLAAALVLFTLIAGLGYATGLVRSIDGEPGVWVHIAVALTLVPLVVWHVWARGIPSDRAGPSSRVGRCCVPVCWLWARSRSTPSRRPRSACWACLGPGAASPATGQRFPIHDLDRLLLATQVDGAPLSADHGFPVRLAAPGRRGYWWVTWIDRIELQTTPLWWQPPFPLG